MSDGKVFLPKDDEEEAEEAVRKFLTMTPEEREACLTAMTLLAAAKLSS